MIKVEPAPSDWSISSDVSTQGAGTRLVTNLNIAASEFARRNRGLMKLHRDLQDLGATAVFDVPRIVVIGGQSAGKSSVVEAVSGLKVPRDIGTCTRCPIECHLLSDASVWSCNISLRFDHAPDGSRQASVPEPFAQNLMDKDSIELWIRRAQLAILSPHIDSAQFQDKSLEELREISKTDAAILKFSRNAVVIHIFDPDATDLSFIDLPGLIQNEEDDVIQLVRSLVETNIDARNTLILVTIPMTDDMENQQAIRLAKEYDRERDRTIGVLTKPDMLANSAQLRQKWKRVLEGEEHPLRHGYYAVRLPNEDERQANITAAEAQKQAAMFFEQTSPWKEMGDRTRFGIPNMIRDMSRQLVQVMEQNLPMLMTEVQKQLDDVQHKLARLPTFIEPENRAAEITILLTGFCMHFTGVVRGQREPRSFVQRNRKTYDAWREKIRATVPDFRPFENPQAYNKLTHSDDELDVADTHLAGTTLGVRDVKRIIDETVTWEWKYNAPFAAREKLVSDCIKRWQNPSMDCFETAFEQLRETMNALVDEHFGQYRKLLTCIKSLVHSEMEERKKAAQEALLKLLALNTAPLYTQNSHYFDSLRTKWHIRYKDARQNSYKFLKFDLENMDNKASPRAQVDYEAEALRNLQSAGFTGLTKESLSLLRPADSFEQEVIVMAETRAYFQVAYKRIIDIFPMAIEHELHQALASNMQGKLLRALFTQDRAAEHFAQLLGEEPAVAKEREFLQKKHAHILSIKARLDAFERDFNY